MIGQPPGKHAARFAWPTEGKRRGTVEWSAAEHTHNAATQEMQDRRKHGLRKVTIAWFRKSNSPQSASKHATALSLALSMIQN
jgi:hypothetical protein